MSDRFREFLEQARTFIGATVSRPARAGRATIASSPVWDRLAHLRARLRWWRLERSYTAALWWAKRIDPVNAAAHRFLSRIGDRLDRAQGWLADRLSPLIRAITEWLDRRASRASDRRERLAESIVRFRRRRLAPMVRAVEDRLPSGAAAAASNARELGLARWAFAILSLVAAATVIRHWSRPAPPIPATEQEIAMVRSFLTATAGPGDPGSWLREVGRSGVDKR